MSLRGLIQLGWRIRSVYFLGQPFPYRIGWPTEHPQSVWRCAQIMRKIQRRQFAKLVARFDGMVLAVPDTTSMEATP